MPAHTHGIQSSTRRPHTSTSSRQIAQLVVAGRLRVGFSLLSISGDSVGLPLLTPAPSATGAALIADSHTADSGSASRFGLRIERA